MNKHRQIPTILLIGAISLSSITLTSYGFDNWPLENLKNFTLKWLTHGLYTLSDKDPLFPTFTSLQEIENALRLLETEALHQLKITFAIPDNEWSEILNTLIATKNAAYKKLTVPNDHVFHNPNLPVSLLERTKFLLTQQNINANAVTISCLTPDLAVDIAELLCQNLALTLPAHNNTPATILFNLDRFLTLSEWEQKYVIGHEITHIKEGHCYNNTIAKSIALLSQLPISSVKEHPDYIYYNKIQELIADVLLSIQHKETAHIVFKAIQERYRKGGNNSDGIHPSPAEGYHWMNAIVTCHNTQHTISISEICSV